MAAGGSGLSGSALMFVFLDISSLPRHRRLLEQELGLRVVENQFHPPHEHHGLVKYDCGGTIVSLNLFAERRFRHDDSDGLTVVYSVAGAENLRERLSGYGRWGGQVFTDVDGHHYEFRASTNGQRNAEVIQLRLAVPDLAASIPFYRDVLGLRPLAENATSSRFATGTVDLVLEQREAAADGRPVRYSAHLLVFHTADVVATERALVARGLTSTGTGFSDIGGTARFRDPAGHTFCLYEPSAESLAWGSGDKVRQLAATPQRKET